MIRDNETYVQYRICHISTVHTVKDIRIFYKECRSLVKAGYEVIYIVSHDRTEILEGVHIMPLPFTESRIRRIMIHTFLAMKKAIKLKAQVYHIHDPELLPIGCILSLLGKKVIYDAHEHLSKDILDKPWISSSFVRKLVSAFSGFIEQMSVRFFSGVIGATSHIAEQFDSLKTVAIRNFPMFNYIAQVPKPVVPNDGIRRIVYTGGLTRIRGIVQMVTAMDLAPANTKLILAGQWEDSALENECMIKAGWRKCSYMGQVPQREAYSLMKGADIGILTFLPAANHYEAMPNKAFEYMACGLPMIISDFPYWRELFTENALYVDPTNPTSIAKGIILMLEKLNSEETQNSMTSEMLTGTLSWESEEKVLIDFYSKILQNH
jgi:glycosyltransferase involved in cell wall biosynthesis